MQVLSVNLFEKADIKNVFFEEQTKTFSKQQKLFET
jgi:hypothetical protein